MFKYDEKTATMTTRQGDSFSFEVEGVEVGWTLFFSVYDIKRNIILEVSSEPDEMSSAQFWVSPADSNKLTVSKGKKVETYYYSFKRCKRLETGEVIEDTLIIEGKDVSDMNKFIVYPLTTEGFEND